MSAPQTSTSVATRSNQGTVAPKEALKLRLDLNLEVEIAIQAKVNGDITLSLLKCLLRTWRDRVGVPLSGSGEDYAFTYRLD
ncbi:uncharacterized protein EV420DRAFT_1646877 [Desarmillaria tabescens]|uniref:Uncharacterized protein n=1 Tax=Armillaria tabescens TaxID=1929756 RepID=A0AA39MWF1_ARMTA|nr:uncharacterized protein EV420DRAFT_1646877 [Desarmillaria tabescens]KAK0449551.1 hypothetical protein EV420DRAFT_1646877 [Desarmillaria tabescens]